MYKYLFILVILVFSSCQKQAQLTNDKIDIISIEDNENSTKEESFNNVLSLQQEEEIKSDVASILYEGDFTSDAVSIPYEGNLTLENILGSWWEGTPQGPIIFEFTDTGILYIREYDRNYDFIIENFYPYKVQENNIIIGEINKSNDLDRDVKDFLLSSGAYITRLDDKALYFEKVINYDNSSYKDWLNFYKGTIEELIERRN